ncbi:MAG: nickel pincer cofactor biosynthesis protein LarC [Candidatus Aminicenantes bacterium]|nr:nickel pincer cofactor biosynthesis protein LarC [Candidatus Aminicenantes bacterium]
MKYLYFDAAAGLSGDMILGALLDLGIPPDSFKEAVAGLGLPVDIKIYDTKRSSLRGLKVDVNVKRQDTTARHWADIESLINDSPFKDIVKKRALAIFKNLFKAEAKVHGNDFHKAHLHEAGADDAIVDILGASFLLEELNIKEVYCSSLNVGQGWVKCSHGVLPVPPPAVAELLKNIPVYTAWAKEELVTPTGAAIITTIAKDFIPFPEIQYQKIGWGAGGRDLKDFPNLLRVFYGEQKDFRPEKRVYQIEVNIDDANPQILASFLDKALDLGALDAYMTPVSMKKNRLGTKLTLLADLSHLDRLTRAVFEETSSIGVRYFPVSRYILERRIEKIKVLGEEIAVKIASLEGKDVNIQPEYDDCQKVAEKKNVPLKKVMELALKAFIRSF